MKKQGKIIKLLTIFVVIIMLTSMLPIDYMLNGDNKSINQQVSQDDKALLNQRIDSSNRRRLERKNDIRLTESMKEVANNKDMNKMGMIGGNSIELDQSGGMQYPYNTDPGTHPIDAMTKPNGYIGNWQQSPYAMQACDSPPLEYAWQRSMMVPMKHYNIHQTVPEALFKAFANKETVFQAFNRMTAFVLPSTTSHPYVDGELALEFRFMYSIRTRRSPILRKMMGNYPFLSTDQCVAMHHIVNMPRDKAKQQLQQMIAGMEPIGGAQGQALYEIDANFNGQIKTGFVAIPPWMMKYASNQLDWKGNNYVPEGWLDIPAAQRKLELLEPVGTIIEAEQQLTDTIRELLESGITLISRIHLDGIANQMELLYQQEIDGIWQQVKVVVPYVTEVYDYTSDFLKEGAQIWTKTIEIMTELGVYTWEIQTDLVKFYESPGIGEAIINGLVNWLSDLIANNWQEALNLLINALLTYIYSNNEGEPPGGEVEAGGVVETTTEENGIEIPAIMVIIILRTDLGKPVDQIDLYGIRVGISDGIIDPEKGGDVDGDGVIDTVFDWVKNNWKIIVVAIAIGAIFVGAYFLYGAGAAAGAGSYFQIVSTWMIGGLVTLLFGGEEEELEPAELEIGERTKDTDGDGIINVNEQYYGWPVEDGSSMYKVDSLGKRDPMRWTTLGSSPNDCVQSVYTTGKIYGHTQPCMGTEYETAWVTYLSEKIDNTAQNFVMDYDFEEKGGVEFRGITGAADWKTQFEAEFLYDGGYVTLELTAYDGNDVLTETHSMINMPSNGELEWEVKGAKNIAITIYYPGGSESIVIDEYVMNPGTNPEISIFEIGFKGHTYTQDGYWEIDRVETYPVTKISPAYYDSFRSSMRNSYYEENTGDGVFTTRYGDRYEPYNKHEMTFEYTNDEYVWNELNDNWAITSEKSLETINYPNGDDFSFKLLSGDPGYDHDGAIYTEFEHRSIVYEMQDGSIEAWVYQDSSSYMRPSVWMRASSTSGVYGFEDGIQLYLYHDRLWLYGITDNQQELLDEFEIGYETGNDWWHIKLEVRGEKISGWAVDDPLSLDHANYEPMVEYYDAERKYQFPGRPAISGNSKLAGGGQELYFDSIKIREIEDLYYNFEDPQNHDFAYSSAGTETYGVVCDQGNVYEGSCSYQTTESSYRNDDVKTIAIEEFKDGMISSWVYPSASYQKPSVWLGADEGMRTPEGYDAFQGVQLFLYGDKLAMLGWSGGTSTLLGSLVLGEMVGAKWWRLDLSISKSVIRGYLWNGTNYVGLIEYDDSAEHYIRLGRPAISADTWVESEYTSFDNVIIDRYDNEDLMIRYDGQATGDASKSVVHELPELDYASEILTFFSYNSEGGTFSSIELLYDNGNTAFELLIVHGLGWSEPWLVLISYDISGNQIYYNDDYGFIPASSRNATLVVSLGDDTLGVVVEIDDIIVGEQVGITNSEELSRVKYSMSVDENTIQGAELLIESLSVHGTYYPKLIIWNDGFEDELSLNELNNEWYEQSDATFDIQETAGMLNYYYLGGATGWDSSTVRKTIQLNESQELLTGFRWKYGGDAEMGKMSYELYSTADSESKLIISFIDTWDTNSGYLKIEAKDDQSNVVELAEIGKYSYGINDGSVSVKIIVLNSTAMHIKVNSIFGNYNKVVNGFEIDQIDQLKMTTSASETYTNTNQAFMWDYNEERLLYKDGMSDNPTISGPTLVKLVENTWNIVANDEDSDLVKYLVYWGDGEVTETDYNPVGEAVVLAHTYQNEGTYDISYYAKSPYSSYTADLIMQVEVTNDFPPATPSISGPEDADPGDENTWTFTTTDTDSSTVYYEITWGDGNVETVSGTSGSNTAVSHVYSTEGTFSITVKAYSVYSGSKSWSGESPAHSVTSDDAEPTKPTISGSTHLEPSEQGTWTFITTDEDSSSITWEIDWGDGSAIETVTALETTSHTYTYTSAGTYYIKVRARSAYSGWSSWSDAYSVVVRVNTQPNKPSTPTGPDSGDEGQSLTFSFTGTDPNGDNIRYQIDWGDGSTTTTGYYASGTTVSVSHSFTVGSDTDVSIKVRTQDVFGDWSVYSDSKIVHIYDVTCEVIWKCGPMSLDLGDQDTDHAKDEDRFGKFVVNLSLMVRNGYLELIMMLGAAMLIYLQSKKEIFSKFIRKNKT